MKANSIKFYFVFLPLILGACAASKTSEGLSLTPTIYYKPTIQQNKTKCSSNSLRDLLDPQGHTLVTLCESDYKKCLMQGSCFVEQDGKLKSYNYHSKKEDLPRFIEVDLKTCPFGLGVKKICLDPYFSVAADLKIYSEGDVIYVPRLEGAVMPNGEIHDGFLVIRDSGGDITGEGRFDFFTGFLSHLEKENIMARLGFGEPKNRFEYRMATEAESRAARERRNYPGLKKSILRDFEE